MNPFSCVCNAGWAYRVHTELLPKSVSLPGVWAHDGCSEEWRHSAILKLGNPQ